MLAGHSVLRWADDIIGTVETFPCRCFFIYIEAWKQIAERITTAAFLQILEREKWIQTVFYHIVVEDILTESTEYNMTHGHIKSTNQRNAAFLKWLMNLTFPQLVTGFQMTVCRYQSIDRSWYFQQEKGRLHFLLIKWCQEVIF